jgi:hypothetical protein
LAGAIQTVEGAKVVTAPKVGTGSQGLTLAVVEVTGDTRLSRVAAAVEGAKTPHTAKSPPGVLAVIPGKVKPGTTPESIRDALMKADILEQ